MPACLRDRSRGAEEVDDADPQTERIALPLADPDFLDRCAESLLAVRTKCTISVDAVPSSQDESCCKSFVVIYWRLRNEQSNIHGANSFFVGRP